MNENLATRALNFIRAGQLKEASQLYRNLLADCPDHADSLNLLGVIAAQTNESAQAQKLVGHAIQIDGQVPRYHHNFGHIQRKAGDVAGAALSYRTALSLAPSLTESHHVLATLLQSEEDFAGAIPRYYATLALQPDLAEAYNNLATTQKALRHTDHAVVSYRRAIAVKPTLIAALNNLGLLLTEREELVAAGACFTQLLVIEPANGRALSAVASLRKAACDWRSAERDERVFQRLVQDDSMGFSPFYLVFINATAADQLRYARQWTREHIKQLPALAAGRQFAANGKIRLGYLSADFGVHPTAQLIVEMLERHDRAQFEVILYSLGRDDGSPMRRRLEGAVDRMVDLSACSSSDAAQIIDRDGIDILVDLMGHGKQARQQILAARPASIQVNFLGYPGTSGADFIDYLIADRVVLPMDQQVHFSEKIVYLPHCYQPNDRQKRITDTAPSRADCGLPERGFVFCCFNDTIKISPQMFDLWMRLLHKTPTSVLWLLGARQATIDNLRREAARRGVAAERLIFAKRAPLADHLARHCHADLFLDTLPCNAHTTASDALWAGLPVLTCQGDSFAGRVAASLLHTIGLPELVTESLDHYEQMALRLANDPVLLAQCRQRLAINRLKSPLFDGETFARNIEAAYSMMGQKQCAGLSPQSFSVEGEPWHRRALSAFLQGAHDRAGALLSCAIALEPGMAGYYCNLGCILLEQEKFCLAEMSFRRAVVLDTSLPRLFHNLGITLYHRGRPADAELCFRRAIALEPHLADAHDLLGLAVREQGRIAESRRCHAHAAALAPDSSAAHYNLAIALLEQNLVDDAITHCRQAVDLAPADGQSRALLLSARRIGCDWPGTVDDEERLLAQVRQGHGGIEPFGLLALDSTPDDQLRCAQRWVAKMTKDVTVLQAHQRSRARERIRLGYLSADFRDHAISHLVVEMLERHDRSRFEITAYSIGPDDKSALRQRIERAADRFVDLANCASETAAGIIRANEIDILVDLTGHTKSSRPRILAARPASLQVNFLGYPATSGAEYIDYIIADLIVLPLDQQAFFSEKIVHVTGCYQPNDSQRRIADTSPSRPACGLPERGFVFCCFNNSYKITPAMFDLWMRLLRAVPNSVLWLLHGNHTATGNLRRAAAAQGITSDRLIFAPHQPLAEHLVRHRHADLFLDTLPYNAHTTASDALWAGLPLLTCLGSTFAGRVAASLLHTLGLPDLVVNSLDHYEQRALQLAREPALLRQLRQRLSANRQTSSLFDGAAFAHSIEKVYDFLWQNWCEKQSTHGAKRR